MTSLTITLPLPPKEVSQNARCHWRKKGPITKKQRIDALLCAVYVVNRSVLVSPRWKKASVKIRAHFPTKRHPDPMNFIGSLKASFDGLEDAGIIENDRGLWPERPEFFTDAKNPRVELTITEEA